MVEECALRPTDVLIKVAGADVPKIFYQRIGRKGSVEWKPIEELL